MAFEDTAPILSSLGVTQTQVHTFFDNQIEPPSAPVEPEYTRAKAVAIGQAVYIEGIENSGGLKGIARAVRLTPWQVKAVIKELRAEQAVWAAEQDA